MKNYTVIADGDYVRERREILRDFFVWKKMTDEEKAFFKMCRKCKAYDKYAEDKEHNTCPCTACEHHKTEIQVDNIKKAMLNKYWR